MEHRKTQDAVSLSFPNGFDFFDHGKVKAATKLAPIHEIPFIVTFRVIDRELGNSELGLCAVVFERKPSDESMGVEIANILASKFATLLSDSTQNLIEVSVPEVLLRTEKRHRLVIATLQNAAINATNAKQYEYVNGSTKLALQLIYLPALQGNT